MITLQKFFRMRWSLYILRLFYLFETLKIYQGIFQSNQNMPPSVNQRPEVYSAIHIAHLDSLVHHRWHVCSCRSIFVCCLISYWQWWLRRPAAWCNDALYAHKAVYKAWSELKYNIPLVLLRQLKKLFTWLHIAASL